jgi:thioredoxin reductase (NADPH)
MENTRGAIARRGHALLFRMLEVVIIGAGPAGLTAAIYLGRFHRPPLVIDGSASRARWIPRSHNILGFPQGIVGPALLSQLRAHAEQYGARIRQETVQNVVRCEGGFELHLTTDTLRSRFVVLATGVQDHLPELPGATEALLRGVLRVCPICDAYEATGKDIAVISDGPRGEREAEFLRTYSNFITLIHLGSAYDPEPRGRLEARGIPVIEASLACLTIENDELRVRLPSGDTRKFEVFYAALGCSPRNGLATSVGAACDENGQLIVSSHCQTSIPGLYAVGDVVRGLNQVVVAAAEAAIATTDIHNRLRNT